LSPELELFGVFVIDSPALTLSETWTQSWNYRLVIDNRWRYSLLFFYRISFRLYCCFIEYQFVFTFSLLNSNPACTLTSFLLLRAYYWKDWIKREQVKPFVC